MSTERMRLLRALRAVRPQDGGASRVLVGAASDGERFELRKQQLLRTDWGANSRHGHIRIHDGFELDATFDGEILELLLHGYEVDGALEPDETAVLAEYGEYDTSGVSHDLSLPTWAPQQQRAVTAALARERYAAGGMLLRQVPPPGVRLLLQMPDGGGIPRFVQAGTNLPPWQMLSDYWRREWLSVVERLVTGRNRNAPHLLLDVLLPDVPGPLVALELLAYDWRDVRPMNAVQRLALLDQGLSESALRTPEIITLARIDSPSRHTFGRVALITDDAPYHSTLLLTGGL